MIELKETLPEDQLPQNETEINHAEITDELPIGNFVLPEGGIDSTNGKKLFPDMSVIDDNHAIIIQYPFSLSKIEKEVDINLHLNKEDLPEVFSIEKVNRPSVKVIIFVLEDHSDISWVDTPENRLALLKKYNLKPLTIPEICTFAKYYFNPYPILCYGSEKYLGSTAREIVITRNRGFSSFFKPRNTIHGVSFGCSHLYHPVSSRGKGIMYMAKNVLSKNKN